MNIANKISIFRILSVPFFIACLLYYSPSRDHLRFWALGIFVLAVISDAVDGYIARKAKQKSKAGAILDPLADKLLLISSYICLYVVDDFPMKIKFPIWVPLTVISRDVIILLGSIIIFMIKQDLKVSPTKWGKLTTTFQMLAIICVLLQLSYSNVIWSIAVVLTIISGVDYLRKGFKIIYAVDNTRNHH